MKPTNSQPALAPGEGVTQRVRNHLSQFTPNEAAIAGYLLANLSTIAFETADSLSLKVGTSAVTIGRFCRRLGFRNFRDLKEALRVEQLAAPWVTGPALDSFVADGDDDAAQRSFQAEVAALADIYRQRESQTWAGVVGLLAGARRVYVAGFQTERGMGATLAHYLQYIRADVVLIDDGAGSFADVLLDAAPDDVVVLVDIRRYSRHALALAERLGPKPVPLVVLTDKECSWAHLHTAHVLAVETGAGLFWVSAAPLASLINLLANDVVRALGPKVETRLAAVSELYEAFTGHVGVGKA